MQNKQEAGIPDEIIFKVDSKIELTPLEQQKLLLLSLVIKPDSVLHIRSYFGLGDDNCSAKEVRILKDRYGNLTTALQSANPDDFPARSTRVRSLCERAVQLRDFLTTHQNNDDVTAILDELFPLEDEGTRIMRAQLNELREEDDTLSILYSKLIDYMRSVPTTPTNIRIMTLMGSKGLEAEHVTLWVVIKVICQAQTDHHI